MQESEKLLRQLFAYPFALAATSVLGKLIFKQLADAIQLAFAMDGWLLTSICCPYSKSAA